MKTTPILKPLSLRKIGENANKGYTDWMKYIHKEVSKINKKKFNIK